jgi:hypothetical protein
MDNLDKLATLAKRRQTKQKHHTVYVGHHYAQANTRNVSKTRALQQTTGGKDEPNIIVIIACLISLLSVTTLLSTNLHHVR